MKRAVYRRFGPPEVLAVEEFPDPRPGRGQVLVRVRAAALNPKDILIRKGKLVLVTGRGFPRPTGFDLAGEVVAVGDGVTRFAAGDAVFGALDGVRGGTVGELVCAREVELGRKPPSLSFEEAAAVPLVGQTALQALRDLARLRPGERVCVHGASGGLGTMVVQVARALGARVTSVSSAANRELCLSLGAEEALDYRNPDGVARTFDVFMDCFGDRPLPRVRPLLAPGGRHISVVMKPRVFVDDILGRLGLGPSRAVIVRPRPADLEQLARWIDEGKVRPVIDRVFPLAQIADAHRQIETKRSRGKVVIAIT